MIYKDFLFSKKTVIYPANSDRRNHNNDDATKRTDDRKESKIGKTNLRCKLIQNTCIEYR